MSNRQCTITHASENRDEPNFKIVDSPVPTEVAADEVLLKVLVGALCEERPLIHVHFTLLLCLTASSL